MSEPVNPPYPQQRTPEQHDAVRRRALPIALSGAILGLGGTLWMLLDPVTAFKPPSPYAINLSFCGVLFGIGIIFYAKGTSGNRAAITLCVIAIVSSLFGPLIFSKQVVEYHRLAEAKELANVAAIAAAARDYAAAHEGKFPPDLLALLDAHLPPDCLQSPLAFTRDPRQRTDVLHNLDSLRKTTSHDDLVKAVDTESDYLYVGGDLHDVPSMGPAAHDLIVASSNGTIMRVNLALSFADGTSHFITMDEVPTILEANNSQRAKLGLGALRPPPIIQHAIEESASQPSQ